MVIPQLPAEIWLTIIVMSGEWGILEMSGSIIRVFLSGQMKCMTNSHRKVERRAVGSDLVSL